MGLFLVYYPAAAKRNNICNGAPFVNAFRVFREAYLLAGDYPHESIYMLQHLFNNWFVNLDIQKMTAAAVMLVILTGGILGAEEWWKNHTKKIEERRI